MKRLVVVASALALSACATPETRVRTALIDAGLSQAHCYLHGRPDGRSAFADSA